MDVSVTGHHCQISPELREEVTQRIESLERLRERIIRVEVDFSAGEVKNPSDAVRVQITLRSKGPVIRAEGKAADKHQAFEQALERLRSQLRRAADRRKSHRGLRLADVAPELADLVDAEGGPETEPRKEVEDLVIEGDGPLVVKRKEFDGIPLTLAQALDEMELVGHDFFLYQDKESGKPSVVYRRKAYNYGVIHLNVGV